MTKDIADRFEKWWSEEGRPFRGSISRKELAELAFTKGVEIGTAWSRSAVDPNRIHFANGSVDDLP